jgi:hypothetical protein
MQQRKHRRLAAHTLNPPHHTGEKQWPNKLIQPRKSLTEEPDDLSGKRLTKTKVLFCVTDQIRIGVLICGLPRKAASLAAARIGHTISDAVVQGGIQLPQLGSPGFPRFLVLAEFRIGPIGLLKQQTAPLVFNGPIKRFL